MKLGCSLARTDVPLVSNLGGRGDSATEMKKTTQRSTSQNGDHEGPPTGHVTAYLENCPMAAFNLADKGIIIDPRSCYGVWIKWKPEETGELPFHVMD